MKIENHIAVVSQTNRMTFADVGDICAAIEDQLALDVFPIWGRRTHIAAFKDAKSIPHGHWPALIQDNIHEPGAAGFHTDKNNQPVIFVQYAGEDTALTLSHEAVETPPDPFGNRLISVVHPELGAIQILCEICDPPEAVSYERRGVKVSDFIKPEWYDTAAKVGMTYSFNGACKTPLSLVKGGYFSFIQKGRWRQATWFGGSKPSVRNLGRLDETKMLREWVDGQTAIYRRRLAE